MSRRPKSSSQDRRRARRGRHEVLVRVRGDARRDVSFDAPDLRSCLDALDAGAKPRDQQLRAALHQLRAIRAFVDQHSRPDDNLPVRSWVEDHIDVLRWCLDQPPAQRLRLCSTCRRRPARIDDLCKRCAEAAGIRPRGKI
jgi:hypothetical protein